MSSNWGTSPYPTALVMADIVTDTIPAHSVVAGVCVCGGGGGGGLVCVFMVFVCGCMFVWVTE